MSAPRPLQNRVDPFGALHATPERGAMMGNCGGRLHDDGQRLVRRWASRRWIACLGAFKGRRREVWGAGYSELFFLDEATALAAGHRPCFECRREDAKRFAAAFAAPGPPMPADAMDAVLHKERLDGRAKRMARRPFATLPDGAFVAVAGQAMLVWGRALHPWGFGGYGGPVARPADGEAEVLTPPSILKALAKGYRVATALTGLGGTRQVGVSTGKRDGT